MQPLLDRAAFSLEAGERIGLIGRNGTGKSSLLGVVAGRVALDDGELRAQDGLAVVVVEQEPELPLAPTLRQSLVLRGAIEAIADERDRWRAEARLDEWLHRFGLDRPIAPERASGGERKRAALALAFALEPDLLLLDEPTNHLDMETREALTMALSSFGGALVLVSHDRHLLRAATDQLWLVHDGRVAPFEGDLDEYAALVLASRKVAREGEPRLASAEGVNRRDERREAARARQRLTDARRPVQQKIDRLEDEIARLTTELRELDARLAAPDFYHGAGDEVAAALRTRGTLATRLEQLESRWLGLHSELEAIT